MPTIGHVALDYFDNERQFTLHDIRPLMTTVEGCRQMTNNHEKVFYAIDCSDYFDDTGAFAVTDINSPTISLLKALSITLNTDLDNKLIRKSISTAVETYIASIVDIKEGSRVYCEAPLSRTGIEGNGMYLSFLHKDESSHEKLFARSKEFNFFYNLAKSEQLEFENFKSVNFWAVLNDKQHKVEHNVLGFQLENEDTDLMYISQPTIGAFHLFDATHYLHGNVYIGDLKHKEYDRKGIDMACFYDAK